MSKRQSVDLKVWNSTKPENLYFPFLGPKVLNSKSRFAFNFSKYVQVFSSGGSFLMFHPRALKPAGCLVLALVSGCSILSIL